MKTGSIGIRRAKLADAATIADVHDSAWRYAYRGVLPGAELERMIARRGPAWWHRAIQRRVSIMVLEVADTVRGYVTFGSSRARSLPYRGEIYELYIQPEFCGLGFGSLLFDASRTALTNEGRRSFVVWALSDNETACGFYSHLGGRAVATAEETIGSVRLPKIAYGFSPRNPRTRGQTD
ncbi:GNAT family N-acetyltransferase [Amorphus orientalis]|uniref:Ribosomal protein S18 acetylase RimI-like enzyme n=1 Tax=Amorphus orientalis TaxID=649198 RepID=A0AAE4AR66_9HYPH|nr:GNAT family N-acetyltransferase [Amorphus orientalis]MDQ0313783.1 ribosomal protein S18 acetylase RimI-like enzyme [Amorphus orientalis]